MKKKGIEIQEDSPPSLMGIRLSIIILCLYKFLIIKAKYYAVVSLQWTLFVLYLSTKQLISIFKYNVITICYSIQKIDNCYTCCSKGNC